MKNSIILTVLFFLFNAAVTLAQEPTTQDEYNYCTKGYKSVEESGVDLKAGYKAKQLASAKYKSGYTYTANVKGLYRDGEDKPCALIIIADLDGKKNYLCVPTNDADVALWDSYEGAFKELLAQKQYVVALALAKAAIK